MSEMASAGTVATSAPSTAGVSSGSASTSSGPSKSPQSTQPTGARATATGAQNTPQNVNPNAQGLNKPNTEAQAASETEKPTTPEPRRLGDQDLDALVTVKINGKTQDLPLKEVIKLQQLEQASHEKMRQAAEAQRRANELMQLDIDKFAQLRGLDLDSLAEERLAKKYELMQMTPEQRRLHELEAKESQRQAQQKQVSEKILGEIKALTNGELPQGIDKATPEQLQAYLEQTKQVAQMVEQNIEREFTDAWKETGLPKSKYFGSLMAFHMMNSKNPDGTPLQAAQAASKVKQEFFGNTREIAGQMDAKAIHDWLGKEVIDKLREYDVQRVTAHQAASSMPQRSPAAEAASNQKKQYVNQMEWRKAMGLE